MGKLRVPARSSGGEGAQLQAASGDCLFHLIRRCAGQKRGRLNGDCRGYSQGSSLTPDELHQQAPIKSNEWSRGLFSCPVHALSL